MIKILQNELMKVVTKAVLHAEHVKPDENSQLTPEMGALVRDVGKDRAMTAMQLKRSMGSLAFAENLAKCIVTSPYRRRLKK